MEEDVEHTVGVTLLTTLGHHKAIVRELDTLCEAAKDKDWGKYLLGLAEVLYHVCDLTQQAGLKTILSATFSLKHAARTNQTFTSQRNGLESL